MKNLNKGNTKYCKYCKSHEDLSHFLPMVKSNGQNFMRCKVFLENKGATKRYCSSCKKSVTFDHFKEIQTINGNTIMACKITLDKNDNKLFGILPPHENFKNYKKKRKKSLEYELYSEEYERDRYLQRKYGISLKDYNNLLKLQNNTCGICGKEESYIDHWNKKVKVLAVDHDHKTGKVRGLLCSGCNTSLGKFGDDVNTLQNAIDYLNKYK